MKEEIKKWPTGKAKALEELIDVTKKRDACRIEICDLVRTVLNHKQEIAHSLKELKHLHLMCSMMQLPSKKKNYVVRSGQYYSKIEQ